MINDDLSERQRYLLRAVVQEYVQTAQPVGSQSIAKNYGMGFSPATIGECQGPRWTAQIPPLIDTSNPTITDGRPRPV